MKKQVLVAVTTAIITTSAWAVDLKTEAQKVSYTIGVQMGATLKANANGLIQLDEKVLFSGISDVLAGKNLQLSNQEMSSAMQAFAKKAQAHQKKQYEVMEKKNKEEGDKLLAENKKKAGVKVTDSGLQYRVISEGKGKKPTATDKVIVHYKGTFANGITFDSSYDRKQPAEFPLNAVIKGWTEGLQLMTEGSKYEFVIPSALAYGKQGPADIGPDRVLVFEVELLEIKKPTAKK